jgi:hypothetical protein
MEIVRWNFNREIEIAKLFDSNSVKKKRSVFQNVRIFYLKLKTGVLGEPELFSCPP